MGLRLIARRSRRVSGEERCKSSEPALTTAFLCPGKAIMPHHANTVMQKFDVARNGLVSGKDEANHLYFCVINVLEL